MLVVEDGHALAGLAKDLDDFLHECGARIEDLTAFVARIVAVFADEQDALDGQFVAAERQGVGNRARDAL